MRKEEKKKGKGERERYTQLNAEFQRTARRKKKALFSEQCKEIEENNRMGKTRDLPENYNAVKVLHSMCQQIWKTHQWQQGWKR